MLKIKDFSVIFEVSGVRFREEYSLPYRTEEDSKNEPSTIIQAAKGKIASDLGIRRSQISVIKVMEIHNHLIIE